jgi:hypothetical protein
MGLQMTSQERPEDIDLDEVLTPATPGAQALPSADVDDESESPDDQRS